MQGHRRRWIATAGIAVGTFAVAGAAFVVGPIIQQSLGGSLSCPWPAHIQGSGIQPGQEGAVRCYLKALASGDAGQMQSVMPDPVYQEGDGRVTSAAFVLSKDARDGMATVFIVQNGSDSAYFDACIRFADGRAVDHGFSIADPTDGTSWRVWDPNESDEVVYSPKSNPDDPCLAG